MGEAAPDQPAEDDGSAQGAAKAKRGKASGSMDVTDFLSKGGGAQLPRSQQAKKDREREKRMKGQSSHQVWKSEAEMVLRQQFDS
jgi:hypothetical protein